MTHTHVDHQQRADRIFKATTLAAFIALHKAGKFPPAGSPKAKPDEAECPECGGSMASHAKPAATPGAGVVAGKPPAKPVTGSEVADAGAQALGAPDDESDAIEDLGDDMEDSAEGDGSDEDAIEGLTADDDGEELPEDDGENHGVGDLNEDGSTDSLITEVTALERDYYAAKGLHGDGAPKAMIVLDRFHRAVRSLVRALGGGASAEVAPVPPQGEAPGKPPAAGAKPPGAGGKKPPMGDPIEDLADDEEDDDADGDGQPDGAAAKPAAGGKPPVVPSPPKPIAGDEPGKPNPVDPKLKKSVADKISKSMSDFSTYMDDADVPDSHLIDYFSAFVEEAFEQERSQSAHQWTVMTPMDWARCVLHEFVIRLPKNVNFRRIAAKYNITVGLIAASLIELKLVKPGGDMVGLDSGDGYGDIAVPLDPAQMAEANYGAYKSHSMSKEARGFGRDVAAPSFVQLEAAPLTNPFEALSKSLQGTPFASYAEDAPIVITETASERLAREAKISESLLILNHLSKLG